MSQNPIAGTFDILIGLGVVGGFCMFIYARIAKKTIGEIWGGFWGWVNGESTTKTRGESSRREQIWSPRTIT